MDLEWDEVSPAASTDDVLVVAHRLVVTAGSVHVSEPIPMDGYDTFRLTGECLNFTTAVTITVQVSNLGQNWHTLTGAQVIVSAVGAFQLEHATVGMIAAPLARLHMAGDEGTPASVLDIRIHRARIGA